MADLDQLVKHIAAGRETRNREYKRSTPWEGAFRGALVRTILGMANIQDGGVIVIGIRQEGEQVFRDGVAPEQLDTYRQDQISEYVNGFAAPYVNVVVSRVEYEGRVFVVMEITEFAELPVVCHASYQGELRTGAVYTRSKRMNATVEIQGEAEMRELINLAVDKGMRRMLARVQKWGLAIPLQLAADIQSLEQERGQL